MLQHGQYVQGLYLENAKGVCHDTKVRNSEMVIQDEPSRVDQFRTQGYLIVENLLLPEYIKKLSARMQEIVDGRGSEYPQGDIEFEPGSRDEIPRMVRKINRCAENDPLFLTHARNEKILDVIESMIGPDIKLYESQCFMKPPGGVEKPFHQDSAYFPIGPMDLVTCWTAIDDVTTDNGCVRVIAGSHRHGLVDHGKPWHIGNREDKQVPGDVVDHSQETTITMSAGSCSFHHSLLLHRSGPNNSNQSRRGLAVHYMAAQSKWTDTTHRQPKFLLIRGREYPGCV